MDKFGFEVALQKLRDGKKVARTGWNGHGMFAVYSPGTDALPADKFFSPALQQYAKDNGGTAEVRPCFLLKNADGAICYWTPNTSDILAEDWTDEIE